MDQIQAKKQSQKANSQPTATYESSTRTVPKTGMGDQTI